MGGFILAPGLAALLMTVALVAGAQVGDSPAVPIRPLQNSDIVSRGADGQLAVMKKNGTPINGLKLSQYDALIDSPNIAVGSDGVIHVAFIERQAASPFTLFVYHRQSADGGKSWSEPENLSEDMPNIAVAGCRLLVDSRNRVYVIWRSGLGNYLPAGDGANVNLVYRVLNQGKWSKIIPIHPPGSTAAQNVGALFSFAVIDGAGNAQVVWNACPNTFLPELTVNGMGLAGVGNGLVFQASLDGSSPTPPKQVYMTPVTTNSSLGDYGKMCDDLGDLDGYFDAAGALHFIAIDRAVRGGNNDSPIDLIENGKQTPVVNLPSPYMETWVNPPKLLLDAQGRRHIIAFYHAGEHPSFRDYLVGSDDAPTVILTPKGASATCMGFQAYQGPGGEMAVVMQTTEAGFNDSGDSWISTSDGSTAWSQPVCVTGNAARANYVAKNTGSVLTVGTGDHYGPGPGAIAFDKDGHLLLALVNVKTGSFGLSAGGVLYSGGSVAAPMLFFYKF
jgi:hypothetical protein